MQLLRAIVRRTISEYKNTRCRNISEYGATATLDGVCDRDVRVLRAVEKDATVSVRDVGFRLK